MERKIVISVPQYGPAIVEAVGFNGDGCTEATSPFERALAGNADVSRQYKPEWSNPNTEDQTQEQGLSW